MLDLRNVFLKRHYTITVGNHLRDQEEDNERVYEIDEIILHSRFDPYDYDIALLKLRDSIDYNDHVQPICLPDRNDEEPSGFCAVTGWGDTGAHL